MIKICRWDLLKILIYLLKILCKIRLKKENENLDVLLEGGHCINCDVYLNTQI